jgi:ABC-type branched-subunit amino acid transport system substrate-binding protein
MALVNWVNSNGGLAGHPIKPVFYELDLTRSDPYSTFMAEMCAKWTQDNKVIAAFAYANADFSPVADCLNRKNAVFSSYANYSRQASDFRKIPNWVEPSAISSERLAALQIASLSDQGFLEGQSKVGLLAYDYAAAKTLTSRLVAGLKQRGITAIVYEVRYGNSTPELSGTIASIQSAVLRFRSEGVERVMSAAYPGAIGFFMRYADSQNYRPRYGLSSYDSLAALPANAPTSQLEDAVAVGWTPTGDFSAADRGAPNTSGETCRAIFTKAGIPKTQETYSFGYCDFVLSLKAAAQLVGGSAVTGDLLRAGLEGLGASYTAPTSYGTALSRSQHDGISRARPLAFSSACTCWRATGSVAPIP